MITVTYASIDGVRDRRRFKTLYGARLFAHLFLGETPEVGSTYAISGDGIGRVTVDGATLSDLFPKTIAPPENEPHDWHGEGDSPAMIAFENAEDDRLWLEHCRDHGCFEHYVSCNEDIPF